MTASQTPPLPEQNPSSEPATRREAAERAAQEQAQQPASDPSTAPAPDQPVPPAPQQVPPRPPAPQQAAPSSEPEQASPSPAPQQAGSSSEPHAAPGQEPAPYGGPAPEPAPYGEPAQSVPSAPDFPPAGDPIAAPESLDQETYIALREPRAGGLQLDGTWHQISPKYVVSQVVQSVALIVFVVAAALVVSLLSEQPWPWLGAGVIVIIQVVGLIILPRQARALGYMLRADDIVFRRGILWQRVVAVPYGRMQLIDITHGPLDRMFGIAKLKMVTAAASTGVEIPGLTDTAAEALRDTLIDVAETRRTGL